MSTHCTIRRGTLDDVETLARFNEAMARETEDKALHSETVRRGVRRVLTTAGRGFYLVAERDGQRVGSLMVTTEWSDWRNGTFWWIQSVYVRPEVRRSGVYTALHRDVRSRAQAEGDVCGLRLYVERENAGAHEAYRTLGMTETSYRIYEELL